jgi:hypothetical protein
MGEPHVISGLKNKRARIAGEIVALQHQLTQRQDELLMLDSVLRMFTPDNPEMISPIRPGKHSLFFGYREVPRLCMSFMRTAKAPVRFDSIIEYIIATKGLEVDARVRKLIRNNIHHALARMETNGVARRIIDHPDTWWELAG